MAGVAVAPRLNASTGRTRKDRRRDSWSSISPSWVRQCTPTSSGGSLAMICLGGVYGDKKSSRFRLPVRRIPHCGTIASAERNRYDGPGSAEEIADAESRDDQRVGARAPRPSGSAVTTDCLAARYLRRDGDIQTQPAADPQYSGTGGPRYSSPGRRPLSAQHLLRPGA